MIAYPAISPLTGDRHALQQLIGMAGIIDRHHPDSLIEITGMRSFFVTNMIHGLDEAVLRQADNLLLLRVPFDDDVRHVSRGAATDYETMTAFVRRLRQRHALVIGNVTAHYPLMFEVDPLE